jgi:tetratricopeptide (TPR) repeat protein
VRTSRRAPAERSIGYLPLALDHAGAYCALDASMSFDAYREKIDRRIARRPKGALYPDSVAKTFDLAIDKAAAETKAAETLLGFFAYLAPERIPLDLVSDEIVGEEDRSEALIALAGVSLIERAALDDGAPAVTLHRLVQAAMRARLVERGETAATVERVTKRLADAFPNDGYDEPKRWPRCAALLPHVMALREHALWVGGSAEAGGTLLNSAGSYLEGRAAHAEAEPLFREALAIGEKTLGREHPNVVAVLNNLANLLRDTGRHAEAEPLIREALAISEKSLGREHPEIAIRLNVLALLLRQTGRHTEAEQLYREAIAISEKTSRREHPVVARESAQ